MENNTPTVEVAKPKRKRTPRKPKETPVTVTPTPTDGDEHRAEFLADVEQPVSEVVPAPAKVVPIAVAGQALADMKLPEKAKEKEILFKIAISQKGVDVENPILNGLVSEMKVKVIEGKPLDIAKIAGRMATQLFANIKMFKERAKGFNLQYFIDNKLEESFQTKSVGTFKMQNASDLAFSIASLFVSHFDTDNSDGLLTGKINQSSEAKYFVDRLGLNVKAKNLPTIDLLQVVDVKRRVIKKNLQVAKKEVLASLN